MEGRIVRVVGFWGIGLLAAWGAWGQAAKGGLNIGKGGLALGGYDPVSYFEGGGPVKGQASISLECEGALYRFANAESRSLFEREPERFEPAFGGWCAWAMLQGEKVEVDPLRYRIVEGKLLLFYDGFWGDTLKKWMEKSARDGEANLLREATGKWAAIESKNRKDRRSSEPGRDSDE